MSNELIGKIKAALGITGDFLDDTLDVYIDMTVDYMSRAGVSESLVEQSAGVVARGVNDLWNNGSGGKLSPVFYDMVTQLVYKSKAGG